MFKRLRDFRGVPPKNLKRIVRAFYEMKYRPTGGYIHNYDKLTTLTSKLRFLEQRGRIGPDDALTEAQILDRYEAYRRFALGQLELDQSIIY